MKYLAIDFNQTSSLYDKYRSLTIKDLIDIIFSHNEIISLCISEVDPDDDMVSYRREFWKGHAHQLPKEYEDYTFISIFGCIADNITESDTIYIECCEPMSPLQKLVELKAESDYYINNKHNEGCVNACREDN